MRILLVVLLVAFNSTLFSQIGTGQWRMHVPASQAIDVAAGNGFIMTALKNGVLEYDIAASEDRILNKLNALSDIEVSCIAFESTTNSFFVGYKNGNIDQIKNGAVTNIPAVKLAQISGNKKINKIICKDGLVYLATGFAIVIIDPQQREVKDTYYPTNSAQGINDIVFLNDSIYALSPSSLSRGYAPNLFLADPSQWTTDVRVTPPSGAIYAEMDVLDNAIHILYLKNGFGGDSILRLTNSGLDLFIGNSFDMEIKRFHVENELSYVYYDYAIVVFNLDQSVSASYEYYGSTQIQPSKLVQYDGATWIADRINGLVKYNSAVSYTFIQREGPPKNNYFSVNSFRDKVVITGGTIDRVSRQYSLAGAYTFEDESWQLLDKFNQNLWDTATIYDIGTAAINPLNSEEMAIGSYSYAPLSITSGSSVQTVYTTSNSNLESSVIGGADVCLSGVEYDESGNIWVLNSFTNEPLKVRLTDGTWQKFDTGVESKNKFATKLVIDYNGNKWFGTYSTGLVGFNDNGTPSNTADDSYKFLKSGAGSGNLPADNVTALAVDFDNEIWIGTESGFAVLYNSEGVFSAGAGSYDASRILINFEGNVENLLGETSITDIEIDGGNRKWIATANAGIFLLSANGQEVIQQFTIDNSPLISNSIIDMDFNHTTGELFIITDLGLVSYRTDASYEDQEYATTTVFPNPVKPDYFGPVTIQGIRFDSDVRITDVAGNLVYKTTSNGGTATWNGKTIDGNEVTSGVYIIWTATNTEKHKKAGKVVVIR